MNKAKANVTAMPVTTGAPKMSTTEITEELLLCRLCSMKYRVIGQRPLTLRCAHTFCEICLEHLLRDQMDDDATIKHLRPRRNKRQQLVCPTCDAVTPFGRGCTPSSSLPVNHSVMELLEIFDRPAASAGCHEPVRSGDLAPGYSQVKVNTKTSHGQLSTANGSVNPEPNRTLAALAKTKKDTRNGMDPANRYLPVDGYTDETGPSGPANWVSTVNIGKSSPHMQQRHQQKQQQQQQHGSSSFLAGKLSSAHAAASSAVTSVSTLKTHPQQSSTTSPGVVPSSDTNAGTTSSAPAGGGHRCCRCGLRPAAVSVASSSRTMAPQKLCSDCWNQPSQRQDDEERRGGAAAEQNVTTITGTKQSENCGVTAARFSTAKKDARSSGGAPATNPVPPNTKVGSSGPAKNRDSSDHERQTANLVDKRTSTIEVRRRSQYLDNRSRAAPTATAGVTTDPPGTGGTAQPTTTQPSNVSAGSGPPQTSATIVEQRPTTSRWTSGDVQLGVLPETTAEVVSTSSESNAGTGRNTCNHGNTKELDEEGIVHGNMTKVSSAPSIADIHPMPCSNPPYNPDFEEDSHVAWSSAPPHGGHVSDAQAADRVTPNPSETRSKDDRQRMRQLQDVSASTGNRLALSFLMSNSLNRYPPEQPPKYEDIVRENDAAVVPLAPEAPDAVGEVQMPPPAVQPTSTEGSTSAAVTMKLVRSFGKYGEISTQPGAFRAPGRLSVAAKDATGTRVVVADGTNGTVQVFGDAGECLSMLRADAVRGCCLLDDNHRLLIAVDRAVEVYDINGTRLESIPLSGVLNVVPYQRGFIAIQSKSLTLFKGTSFSTPLRTLTSKARPGQFNRVQQFDDVCDVAVNSQQDLVVLEAISGGLITVMADDGYVKSTISPAQLDGCGPLQAPSAVAVDSAHNIVVSESGRGARILLFGANGRLQRVLHGPTVAPSLPPAGARTQPQRLDTGPWPAALAVGPDDRLYVIMRADKFAEIRIYEYL